jgi:uncharacterized protein involved in exopolysaccharide biosynthesis
MVTRVLINQWKFILALLLIAMLAAAAYTWFKKPEYLSVTTALPSSVYANDRSRLFNENIQILYSELGTPDELDVIAASGQLDTVYLAVTDQFNLFDHYQSKQPNAREKSAEILKGKSKVVKTGSGELKVSVWDTDPNLAPQLANAIMDQLQRIHTDARNAGNEHMIARLRISLDSTLVLDSLNAEEIKAIQEKIARLQKLMTEYELISEAKTPALVIIEKARPAIRADRPRCMQILIGTFVLTLLLSFLLAIYRERIKPV